MKDPNELPYAEWLEESIRTLAEEDAVSIGIAAILKNGEVYTAYYNAGIQDKLVLAENIHLDATYAMIKANARSIVEAAEEEEGAE